MQNLKITFKLETPIIIDRNTTIDGILLSAYYGYLKENGKVLPFDAEHKSVNFIERKEGVFSGSVWYLDKNSEVIFDFIKITKKIEDEKIYKYTNTKVKNNSLYKPALLDFETMSTDKLYFYIRAEKEIVEALLSRIKFLGKKNNLGYGKIANIDVEEIEEDKGFFIKPNVVSKPLDCSVFDVKSNSVAFFRTKPPYWSLEDLKPCYMPSGILLEEFIKQDENYNEYEALKTSEYIDNCTFLHDRRVNIKQDLAKEVKDVKLEEINMPKSFEYKIENNNRSLKCCLTQQIKPNGISCDIKSFMKRYKSSWGDWQYILSNEFISYETLWAIENLRIIGYSLVDNDNWVFTQGKKATEETMLKNYIVDTKKFNVPFSLNLKDTQNAQHISFKARVNISNGYVCIQYGNEMLMVDSYTLNQAIQEISEICDNNKELSKTHLTGNFRGVFYPTIKQNENESINQKIVMEFQKKYCKDVRKLLSLVAY
jgi:CRISPR type IV-associated protein Csf3